MVIDNVDITEKRKEEIEEEKEKTKSLNRCKEMAEEFNREANKIGSPYKVKMMSIYPHLYKHLRSWIFEKEVEIKQIFYYKEKDRFSFIGGVSLNLFKEIEPILNSIKSNFEIELGDGEVPNKYKILKELKNGQ